MAEFVIKVADDRGRVQQHVEQGISETERQSAPQRPRSPRELAATEWSGATTEPL